MRRAISTAAVITISAAGIVAASVSAGTAASAGGGPAPHHLARKAHCALPQFGPGASYHPTINPANFAPHITNPFFPLLPGHIYIYAGVSGRQRMTDIVAPSNRTKLIDGVRTRIVNDRLVVGGRITERTKDYYTQDRCGNVWYFGEDTAEFDKHGHLTSREGSFHAGVDGAQPGVYIQRHPQIGRKFRQEWYAGHAEDIYQAIRLHVSGSVQNRPFHGGLVTKEVDALEPGVVDHKVYAPHVGSVVEQTVKGPVERLHLLDLLR